MARVPKKGSRRRDVEVMMALVPRDRRMVVFVRLDSLRGVYVRVVNEYAFQRFQTYLGKLLSSYACKPIMR